MSISTAKASAAAVTIIMSTIMRKANAAAVGTAMSISTAKAKAAAAIITRATRKRSRTAAAAVAAASTKLSLVLGQLRRKKYSPQSEFTKGASAGAAFFTAVIS